MYDQHVKALVLGTQKLQKTRETLYKELIATSFKLGLNQALKPAAQQPCGMVSTAGPASATSATLGTKRLSALVKGTLLSEQGWNVTDRISSV